MKTIATKFVAWDTPSLEDLKDSKVYKLRLKLNSGDKLTRDEKDWITKKALESRLYFNRCAIPLMGWYFDFSDILKTFLVKQPNSSYWTEYKAIDKTALRKAVYGRIEKILIVTD